MEYLLFIVFLRIVTTQAKAGITEMPPAQSSNEDEVVIETVSPSLIPSNIFDVGTVNQKEKTSENPNDLMELEPLFGDTGPIFQAIRDFIFQTGDELLEGTESPITDTTEEIVKIIEKGFIEATTMFMTLSNDENLSTTTVDARPEPISIIKIEDPPSNMIDRIGVSVSSVPNQRQAFSTIGNSTTACSNCYSSLETCVQQCFSKHNCHEVQRQARTCPPPPPRLCTFFTQWSPVDECKSHDDCKSPLLCCNDGCVNKCSQGVWRH